MRVHKVTLYNYDELSEQAKERVVNEQRYINVEHADWWNSTYEDAANIGLVIDGFDDYYATGGLLADTALESIALILDNHGESCETYKIAMKYSELIVADQIAQRCLGCEHWGDEDEDLVQNYVSELLTEYRKTLSQEYDYLTSDDAVIATIRSNEYEFTEAGGLA